MKRSELVALAVCFLAFLAVGSVAVANADTTDVVQSQTFEPPENYDNDC